MNKELKILKLFYSDTQAESALKNKILHKYKDSNSIGLDVHLIGDVVTISENYFPESSEKVCNYDGLTELLIEDFFNEDSRSLAESTKFYSEVKSAISKGNSLPKLDLSQIAEKFIETYPDPFETQR